jgi:hypothetical protein
VRTAHALIESAILTAAVSTAAPAGAACSVFSRVPCFPTVHSVFVHRDCIPYPTYWIGQDLRLTIESVSAAERSASADLAEERSGDHKLDTLCDMFDALRGCWIPPAKEEARPGMQMTVRFAFKRSGNIIAAPRVTYVSQEAAPETRATYLQAITAALERCTPLHFSEGLGNAVAGRPIAVRFVDNRDQP